LKKKKRIHRRTIKKTKGGISTKPLLTAAAGLLAFTNAFKPSGNSNIVMKAPNRIEPIKQYSIGDQFNSRIQNTMSNSLNFVNTNSELGRPYHPTELPSSIRGPPSDLPPDNSEMVFDDEPTNPNESQIDFTEVRDFLREHIKQYITDKIKKAIVEKVKEFTSKINDPVKAKQINFALDKLIESKQFTQSELKKIINEILRLLQQ
jgi:hypothetical protein